MKNHFDVEHIKKNFQRKEELKKESAEQNPQIFLDRLIVALKELFYGTRVEVFLIGSIIQPNRF